VSRKKRLKTKYILRRVVFIFLLLLLLALGAFGLWRLFGGEGEKAPPPSQPREGTSQPAPDATAQTGGEPEPSAPAESQRGEDQNAAPDPEPKPEGTSGLNPSINPDDWRLVLINPTHAIEKELEMEFDEVQGYKFDSRVAGKVRELIAAAKEDGISLAIVSGYRTMERSRMLYANKIAEYKAMGYDEATAKVEAARWVAPPGTSEHHSGLAMDIVSADYYTKYSDLVEAFEKDKEAIWLKENCARFGFILRFPKDKTDITGINFEPWHFRYVGEEHAQAIMEQGICLEEYLGETD
jgi:D-alanyl-D-alanine carboxypeptidase